MEQPFLLVGITTTILEWVVLFCYNEPYNYSMDFVVNLIIVLGVVVGSMILHELAHGVVAFWLGDTSARDAGRLSLNPFKHLDWFMSVLLPLMLALSGGPVFGGAKPVPVDFRRLRFGVWGMALVAIAGPLTNFLLAFIGFLIGHFTGWINMEGVVGTIFVELVLVNLGFFVFNLIPIPPLDGSRVLYALAPNAIQEGMEKMERYGIIIVFGLVVILGEVFSGFMSAVIIGILRGFEFVVGG
jgi:Zn-dependent protease